MFGMKYLNDEHDCNVVSMNSLIMHDDNDMKNHKLGDAMFNEDDISRLPSFDMQICYDDSMPPFYDDYVDEIGFGEVMTLFSDESTISEEVTIDYENKVAICDDYCDDMYAIKKMITMKLVIMILIFNWIIPHMIVILLSLLPQLFMRINLLMWRVRKFLCLCIMKRMI